MRENGPYVSCVRTYQGLDIKPKGFPDRREETESIGAEKRHSERIHAQRNTGTWPGQATCPRDGPQHFETFSFRAEFHYEQVPRKIMENTTLKQIGTYTKNIPGLAKKGNDKNI